MLAVKQLAVEKTSFQLPFLLLFPGLSVKPRSKPLKSYGQTAVFDHFVRNRYFSSGPFTDKEPIFIDLSVNGSDFAKGSAAHHLLNHCT